MDKRPWFALVLLAATLLLASSACPRGSAPAGGNIVLVTIDSLRADRFGPTAPAADPMAATRARLGGRPLLRPVLASSSDTLPSLASLFTGTTPAQHRTLVEGLDRLPPDLPTLASLLHEAGYATGGFPSTVALGLSSGLSRGFDAYGWPPSDVVSQNLPLETDRLNWRVEAGRRPGTAVVTDALQWAQRRAPSKPLFLWVHLSDTAAPYASDRQLLERFQNNAYDAAIAYEDRCVESLIAGFGALGLLDRTTFIVAGDHGESLGAYGESFHGLNLYQPALETVVAILPAPKDTRAASALGEAKGRGRLQDLYATILAAAGVAVPAGNPSAPGLPPIAPERPLLAVTAGPRSAFGWNGLVSLVDGRTAWTGPDEEGLTRVDDAPNGAGSALSAGDTQGRGLRDKALSEAGPILTRLKGRPVVPAAQDRARVLDRMRAAGTALDAGKGDAVLAALGEAWKIDPGNYEVARWLSHTPRPNAAEENLKLLQEIEAKGGGLPESSLAASRVNSGGAAGGAAMMDSVRRACQTAGTSGCTIDLALKLGLSQSFEEASQTLAPVAEKERDADVWRTLGDLYFALENTFRAKQAYDKAAVLKPEDPDILMRQGDCFAAAKDATSAKAKYEAVRKSMPDLPMVEMKLGVLARQLGDKSAAMEHFRKGVGMDTNTVAGSIALGRVYAEQGMTQEALKLFLDAAARDTSSGEALYHAAETAAAEGDLKQATIYLQQSLERDPANAGALYQLARLQTYQGDRKSANTTLEKLATCATTDIAVTALRDPLFAEDAPGAPLAKGMQALYEFVRKSVPAGQALIVGPPPAAPPAQAPAGKP